MLLGALSQYRASVASANDLPIPSATVSRAQISHEGSPMNAIQSEPVSSRGKFPFSRVVPAFAIVLALGITALAAGTLVKVSVDIFTNSASEHKTEVEPDTYAFGSTIVSAFQTARVPAGGSADIGFATSTNGGTTWTHGYLPGLTVNYKNGTFSAASDPSVVYDPKHGVWLILSLPIATNGTVDVAASSSTNGINWANPVIVDKSGVDDKSWITCDTTATSPFYGNCYAEWDQGFSTGLVQMSTSTDGGKTWGPAKSTADHLAGIGGQPLVQPNGTVVVPIESDFTGGIVAFTSTNGGTSWTSSAPVASIDARGQDGGLRSPQLVSATVDGGGTIYVVWSDCRFRTGCPGASSTDDIVMSTSTDGVHWSAVSRIPIDPTTSTVDHFIPGIGADPSTSGSTAHLAMTYYLYPKASCNNSCQLQVGFTVSEDGGQTWTAGKTLSGPMQLTWLTPSDLGPMVADYLAVAYSNGNPFGIFTLAQANIGTTFNEFMATTTAPLLTSADEPRFSSAGEMPVSHPTVHFMRRFYDDEGRNPIPPSAQVRQPPTD
jgi:BNR repeat-like domain